MHLLTVLHFTLFVALHRQSNNHLSSPKVSGNCVSTIQLRRGRPALILLPHRFIFSSISETKESFTFPWASSLCNPPPSSSTHTPHPSFFPALSLTNKSLFNPRLDYNSEVIAWPSSSSPLSEGPPPNLEKQLFINVLLTSLLQCNAGKGSPLGIALMGRARVHLVKQITAKGQ